MLTSTLGQKIIMSVTGLLLISFLIVHLMGNLMLFKADNGATFNAYAHFMSTATFIRFAEVMLILGFLLHLYTAWQLNQRNCRARPQGYIYSRPNANSTWFSRHMGFTGSMILIFLIIHLHNFWFKYKFQDHIPLVVGTDYKDMYFFTKMFFQQEWWFSIFYILAMVFIGFHLVHGFESACQTLGIHHPKYTPLLQKIGLLLGIIISIGFSAMPIYFLILAILS